MPQESPGQKTIDNAFEEYHSDRLVINKHQTRGQSEHELCETWKEKKSARNIHTDIFFLFRTKHANKFELDHIFQRKKLAVDGWTTTSFLIYVDGQWRRLDDLYIRPWFSEDFTVDSRYLNPWAAGYRSGKVVKRSVPSWLKSYCNKEGTLIEFPGSGIVVEINT